MEIIKLNDEQIKCLETHVENNKDAQAAFSNASNLIRCTHEKIWEVIRELFPNYKEKEGELKWKQKEIIFR